MLPCSGKHAEIMFLSKSFECFLKKIYQHRPQIAKNNFCVINVENSATSTRKSSQFVWMPLLRMGTQQWHHVHSPKVGRHPLPPNHSTTTTPPKLVVTLRPTIAHYNGTLQWHHDHSTKNWSSPSAPSHSTLQWHPATVPSHPIRQSGSIGSKNPYSYRYLGNYTSPHCFALAWNAGTKQLSQRL